jgi:acyl-CoA reductase-like NAD-dependent aldehyde dehydrogenase
MWVGPSTGKYFQRENPASLEILAELPFSDKEDADSAVEAAKEAFENSTWPTCRPSERARILLKFAGLIREHLGDLAKALTLENGKPLRFAKGEFEFTADIFEYFAGLARQISGKSYRNSSEIYSLVDKEPVGVCALIAPWNFPISLLAFKLAPALASGCSVVVKPSSYTTAVTLEFLKLFDHVPNLPKGIVNCVSGSGSIVGMELVRHRDVAKIGFTGETSTGKVIMQNAATGLKRLSLECGGKCPNIIFEDANIEKAVVGAVWGAFRNSGQVCTAGSRLLVHKKIYDVFVPRFVELTKEFKVGSGMDPMVNLGPLISREQLEKVLGYIEIGKEEGARLSYGGQTLRGLSNGYYMTPSIFEDVDNDMRIAQEEIFGPVVAIIRFSDESDAVTIANDTQYGLAAAVWTNDLQRAFRVSREIRSGTIWVNTYAEIHPEAPFGGYKESGLGRELSHEGLEEYLQTKHVNYDMRSQVAIWR